MASNNRCIIYGWQFHTRHSRMPVHTLEWHNGFAILTKQATHWCNSCWRSNSLMANRWNVPNGLEATYFSDKPKFFESSASFKPQRRPHSCFFFVHRLENHERAWRFIESEWENCLIKRRQREYENGRIEMLHAKMWRKVFLEWHIVSSSVRQAWYGVWTLKNPGGLWKCLCGIPQVEKVFDSFAFFLLLLIVSLSLFSPFLSPRLSERSPSITDPNAETPTLFITDGLSGLHCSWTTQVAQV